MKFLLGIAVVLLATSATVNAGLDDEIKEKFKDLGDFLAEKGLGKISDVLKKLDEAAKTELKEFATTAKGVALFVKLKVYKTIYKNNQEKLNELKQDDDFKELMDILDKAKAKGCEVTLPVDWLCGQEFKNDQETKLGTQDEGIPDGWEGMDCGPKSMELFASKVAASKTVVWNGPAGVFEFENFSKGTKAILDSVAALHAAGGRGMIGGGDSATAAANFGMEDKVSFVSTGGGASLELLQGELLPGIVALADK